MSLLKPPSRCAPKRGHLKGEARWAPYQYNWILQAITRRDQIEHRGYGQKEAQPSTSKACKNNAPQVGTPWRSLTEAIVLF